MQRAALPRAAAGGPPPSDFPGFRKYSSKENENLACFVCVLRAALCKSRGNLSRGPQNFFIFCLVLRSEEVLVVRSEEMVVLRSEETIIVVGRPIGSRI